MVKKVLSIAGSDSSGGAGIQADIKTISAFGMYAETCITALTAQNTVTVKESLPVPADFLKKQIDAVFEDIFPDAVKIGMIYSPENAEIIAERLLFYKAENIVCDPVMVSTSGKKLISDETVNVLREKLFPISSLITPNIPEAEALTGIKINDTCGMKKAAEIISEKTEAAILVKGGHLNGKSTDILYYDGKFTVFEAPRIDSSNTHGTGCTLSSAVACALAAGKSMEESIDAAKEYVTKAIAAGLTLGRGSGPMWHFENIFPLKIIKNELL